MEYTLPFQLDLLNICLSPVSVAKFYFNAIFYISSYIYSKTTLNNDIIALVC